MTATGTPPAAAARVRLPRAEGGSGGSLLRRCLRIAGGGALAAGLVLAALGAYVPAKAWAGQWLLSRAFAEAQRDGPGVRPWGWADFTPVARITAPRIGADAIALDTATGAAMAWGPGAVPGLDRPGAGLLAFAGHRDTHLAFVADLAPGDEVVVEGLDGVRHRFRVTGAQVVDSRHWRFPAHGAGLLLATCWPLTAQTSGPLRLIVSAEPV